MIKFECVPISVIGSEFLVDMLCAIERPGENVVANGNLSMLVAELFGSWFCSETEISMVDFISECAKHAAFGAEIQIGRLGGSGMRVASPPGLSRSHVVSINVAI